MRDILRVHNIVGAIHELPPRVDLTTIHRLINCNRW